MTKPKIVRLPLSKHALTVLSFNVEGLETMLEDPSFISLVDAHDICLLTETMRSEDSKLNLEGHWDFSQIRPKRKIKGRHSGGITVLVKDNLRPGIKIGVCLDQTRQNIFQFSQ